MVMREVEVDWADLEALRVVALAYRGKVPRKFAEHPVRWTIELCDWKVGGVRDLVTGIAVALRIAYGDGWESHEGDASAAEHALDDITKALDSPPWDYPGQVVRDVEELVRERNRLRDAMEVIDAAASLKLAITDVLAQLGEIVRKNQGG